MPGITKLPPKPLSKPSKANPHSTTSFIFSHIARLTGLTPHHPNNKTFRAINPEVTHTDRVFGSFIQSLDLGEKSFPELNTLHTETNTPETESMESGGTAYDPKDLSVDGNSQGPTPSGAPSHTPGTSYSHLHPHPQSASVQVAEPPYPLNPAAGFYSPIAFDVKLEVDKIWRNVTRNQANATAQIKETLDPIVARVEHNL